MSLAVADRVLDQAERVFVVVNTTGSATGSATSSSATSSSKPNRRQAVADLTYLANVLSALDVQPNPLPRLADLQQKLAS